MSRSLEKIDELFAAAIALPARERAAYLLRACGGDEELFAELDSLLAADERAGMFFDEPLLGGQGRAGHDVADRQGRDLRPFTQRLSRLESPRFPPGTVLAERYRVVSLLGRGGMGDVYRADDLKLGLAVALKFLPIAWEHDPESMARFLDEARLARRVSHPHVCRVHDIGEIEGLPFLSMEHIDGEDLASLLRRVGMLSPEKVVEVGGQLAEGLDAIHRQSVLHRDLKPANILLDERGRARIADFGIALRHADTATSPPLGSPAYMAPEVLAGGEPSERSDLYALGLVLYELTTGRRPFRGSSVSELLAARRKRPAVAPRERVPSLARHVDGVILRCLEPDPVDRPAAARVVAECLIGTPPTSTPGDASAGRHAPCESASDGWRPAIGQCPPQRAHWPLERRLGDGIGGEAWIARHSKTGERRAFKFCERISQLRTCEREVALFRLLKQELGERQDIARVLDWNRAETPAFIETEYTAEGDLIEWAAAQGGLSVISLEERINIIIRVALALDAIHSVGVLHGDTKPASILIARDAQRSVMVRLTGFGRGVVSDPGLLENGQLPSDFTEVPVDGTPPDAASRLYLAPEQLEGKVATAQSELYALGVLLYQMLVGDLERALAPGWRQDLSDELLADVVGGLIDRSPERRLSADQLVRRLRSFMERRGAGDERPHLGREEPIHRADRRTREDRWVLAVLVAALLATVALWLELEPIGRWPWVWGFDVAMQILAIGLLLRRRRPSE